MKKLPPISPPHWLLRFFRWFCHPDYVEDIEGDLRERYAGSTEKAGIRKARWRFLIEVLLLFRPGIIKPVIQNHPLIQYSMFRHNLLITYRSFLRNKSSFLINLIGLSTGLACVLLIYLWVSDEMSIDKFHEEDAQLYQVMQNHKLPNGIQTQNYSPGPLAEAMVQDFPEIEAAANSNNSLFSPKGILSDGDNHLTVDGLFASENYFELFSYDLIVGDPKQILADKNNIVLSKEVALKLFPSIEDAIGKTIIWQNQFLDTTFQVSGVFEDIPNNSTTKFDAVVLYDWLITDDLYAGEWSGGYANTYLLLKKGTDIDPFNNKIAKYLATKSSSWESSTQFVRQYSGGYLYSSYEEGVQAGGRIEYVRLFSIIGLFILLIACINFMNLSTAQASKKMKEIGVKKAIGASRKSLIFQFLSESILMVILSLIIAIGLVVLFLPQFNGITGKNLHLDIHISTFLSIIGMGLVTGLLAGSYPAFYLSSFKPLTILKGKLHTSTRALWIRKSLVVGQFTLSVMFIVGVLVVNKQMGYIQSKNLGYKRDNILSFQRPGFDWNPQIFLSELKTIPGVVNASNVVMTFLGGLDSQGGYSWSGREAEKDYLFQSPKVGYDMIETLGMELIAGRSFSREHNDDGSKIIINESALKMMQLEDPIGKIINYGDQDEREIIGVVKDFHYGSIHKKVEPLIFRHRRLGQNIMVKINAGTESTTLTQIEQLYDKFHPFYPFEFSFMDEDYQTLYEAENRVAVLSKYFSGLAIIISCLGLLGLAAFTAEQRTKEIGIRKVLGASVSSIVVLLSKEFIKLVLIANVIAWPIAWFAMNTWLGNFAYRIDIGWLIFLLTGILALAIAILAVGWQTLRAAVANPVDSLRNE